MNGSQDLLMLSFHYIGLAAPVWLPFLLGMAAWETFVRYNRKSFFASQKYVVLEIRVPKEVAKSPVAMELFLNTVWWTSGESTWYDRNFLGKTRAWFSLEMVSLGGYVHFFIWTREAFQKHIESQIYAQYPGAEVSVAEDYAKKVPEYDPKEIGVFGTEFILSQPDPYPIKTYVDFGLNETATKEEQKVDPLSQILEFLGQLGQGEQFWIQILCRAHKKENPDSANRKWWNPASWNAAKDNWKDESTKLIKKIRSDNTSKFKDPMTGKEQDGFPNLTKGQMETISALERSVAKPGFDVGIRVLYVAKSDSFNGSNIPFLMALLKPFSSPSLNQFRPNNNTSFDYPWQDWNGIRQNKMKRDLLFAYQKRSYFYGPVKEKHIVLNAEELATIYHFPGTVVQTPTLGRILSKKAEPPSNLPI